MNRVGVKLRTDYMYNGSHSQFCYCEYENNERVVVRFFVIDRSLNRVTISRNIIYSNIYLLEKKIKSLYFKLPHYQFEKC